MFQVNICSLDAVKDILTKLSKLRQKYARDPVKRLMKYDTST